MKVFIASMLLAALFIAVSPVAAQNSIGPAPEEIVLNAWTNLDDCNRATARNVLFSTVAADAGALDGQCITVEGYWHGRALFQAASDARSRNSLVKPNLRGRRVGLYADWEMVGDPPTEPRWYRFVGKVGRCETQWPNAMMVMGFCHYTGGPILLVSEVIHDSRTNGR